MSPRSARMLLWLGLALMAPLPVVAGVALTAVFDWYETPFRLASTHSNLFEIFE